MTDTSGNTVNYDWSCQPGADCYPSKVHYNQTTIEFHRELRPDSITFANGSYIGRASYRLKTIEVTVSGSAARAYKLSYQLSPSTFRSRLVSIEQYGKDRTLGYGTVLGGTSVRRMTANYRPTSLAFGPRLVWGASHLYSGRLYPGTHGASALRTEATAR